jgi:hypothetical protein
MSEPIWCNINIATPASWVDPSDDELRPLRGFLAGVILDDDGLINGESDVTVISADGRAHWSWNGEGNYGLYDSAVEEALDWCEANHIPYIATSDTKYDMTGEIRIFDGHESRSGEYNEGVVLTEQDYRMIRANADLSNPWKEVVDYFERLNVAIDQLSVAHLPEFPPEEDE